MKIRRELTPVLQDIVIPNSFVLKGRTFNGFHTLPRHEAERLYTSLVRYGNSCGCDEGALGALLSICLYLSIGVFLPLLLAGPVRATWQLGVVALVAGGVAGKCVGLWWSYRSFERLQREFDALASSQTQTKECTANPSLTEGISHG